MASAFKVPQVSSIRSAGNRFAGAWEKHKEDPTFAKKVLSNRQVVGNTANDANRVASLAGDKSGLNAWRNNARRGMDIAYKTNMKRLNSEE